MKHRGWVVFSGCLWMGIGVFLLRKGLHFLNAARLDPDSISVSLQGVLGSADQMSTLILVFGLLVGFLKSRFVFSKTVARVVHRIQSLPLPIRFSQVYTPAYWMIIGSMMMLGMVFRFLPIPIDLRGFIDVAIGSALMHGGIMYFRKAREMKIVARS